jgi:hypothetical protein
MIAIFWPGSPIFAQESNRLRSAKPVAEIPGPTAPNVGDISVPDVQTTGSALHGIRENNRVFMTGSWDIRPQSYLLLARPAKSEHDKERMPAVPPNLHELPVQPYAYGWFGAKMDRHPRRSFGVRKSYTQWSFE